MRHNKTDSILWVGCKRDGFPLSESDIARWVSLLVEGGVDDTQLGAWLMGVYVHGLSLQETSWPW